MSNVNNLNVKILVDGIELNVVKNTTIIQACLALKKELKKKENSFELEIPRFCFHQELEIAGNCRMCLVEVFKSVKPIVACAMQVTDNMIIKTDTVLVKKARESVLEFLLINHPLDCPVCDQGGECDLQDQIDVFGIDKSRFNEFKRAVAYKSCSSFIKMVMTRCIHCTRCIRFLIDIAGVYSFCLIGRGNKMEVGNFVHKNLKSELSGNIVDLCPVGALTSKATAFKLRFWELSKKETIDVLDNIGADIRVDLRGTRIMRILPRINKFVNNNWITDVTRYSFDSLNVQRFSQPLIRKDSNSLLQKTTWVSVLDFYWKYHYLNNNILLKKINYSFLSGTFTDAYSSIGIKLLANNLGSSYFESRVSESSINLDFRNYYLSSLNLLDFENINLLILLGLNLRLEAPIYNIKIRKLKKKKKLLIISFSNTVNLFYNIKHVSISINLFLKFIEGKHFLSNYLINNNNNMFTYILSGSSLLRRNDSKNLLSIIEYYLKNFNKNCSFGIIQTYLGRITSNECGLLPGKSYFNDKSLYGNNILNKSLFKAPVNCLYTFAGDDYVKLISSITLNNAFNIYVGSQGFNLVDKMHMILPSNYYFEKQTSYLNLEGVVRNSKIVLNLFENAKNEWNIVYLLYLKIITTLNLQKYFVFDKFIIFFNFINYYYYSNKLKLVNIINIFLDKINISNLTFFKIKYKNYFFIKKLKYSLFNLITSFNLFKIFNLLNKLYNNNLNLYNKYSSFNMLKYNNKFKLDINFLKYKITNLLLFYYDYNIMYFNLLKYNFFFSFNLFFNNFYKFDQNFFYKFNYNLYFTFFLLIKKILKKQINISIIYSNIHYNLIFNFIKEYRYLSIQSNTIFFENNIDITIKNRLLQHSSLFLVNQDYYLINNNLSNYSGDFILLNNIRKKYYIKNYPFVSYIDNFYKTNIVSILSTRMTSVNLKYKYKILFSNYL